MSDAHSPSQPGERVCVKHITNHPVCFALVEPAFGSTSDDSAGILASVLEQSQAFTNFRRRIYGWVVQQQTQDSTH